MSRRMDREDVDRMEPQGVKNRRFWDDPRCVEDAKGWVQPFANWQGWEELNRAAYALHSIITLSRLKRPSEGPIFCDDGTINRREPHRSMDGARLESDLRSFHFHIGSSHRCDRPSLP